MFLKNCWYLACWSHEVVHGAPLARRLLGEPVVLWRTQAGEVVAFIDRCVHRMAPLSRGQQEGDSLRCMYHGLRFDARGQCVEIPCQTEIPGNFKVRTYPLVERCGGVWIWMGEPEQCDRSTVPDFDRLHTPEWTGAPAYMHYDAGFELVRDNLLDLSHVAFVHRTTLTGSTSAATERPTLERLPWGLRLTNWHLGEPLPPYYRGVARFEGLVDRWFIATAYAQSNVVLIDGGSAPTGTGAQQGTIVPEALVHCGVHVLTPETERTTHYFYDVRRRFAQNDEEITRVIAERFGAAFLEDKVMIESQASNLDPQVLMQVIRSDDALLYMRRLTRRLVSAEQGEPAQSTSVASDPATSSSNP